MWLVVVVLILFSLLPSDIKDNPELLRGIGFFILGIGIAPLGLLLAYRRTESLQIQAKTEKEKAVTEAFAKSVELLGNARSSARQGGIYALGRLARDNKGLHPMIMDIAASYIKEQSLDRFLSEKEKRKMQEDKPLIDALSSEPMPMDIEAAITVIRERNTEHDKTPQGKQYLMDLSNAYIFNADFSNTDLSNSNFSDSVMINCIFDKTDLSGSNFVASNLTGSSMTQEQVNSMKDINDKTIFPEGLQPPEEQQ